MSENKNSFVIIKKGTTVPVAEGQNLEELEPQLAEEVSGEKEFLHQLQNVLKVVTKPDSEDIYHEGEVTDTFTPELQEALGAFQTDYSADRTDGVPTPATLEKIKEIWEQQGCPAIPLSPGVTLPPEITYASWSTLVGHFGEDIKIRANATGFDDGTEVTFNLFEDKVLLGEPIKVVTGSLENGEVEVELSLEFDHEMLEYEMNKIYMKVQVGDLGREYESLLQIKGEKFGQQPPQEPMLGD